MVKQEMDKCSCKDVVIGTNLNSSNISIPTMTIRKMIVFKQGFDLLTKSGKF